MKKVSILIVFVSLGFLLADYSIQNVSEEYRMYKGDQHFMSLIYQDSIYAFCPHPGNDPNGWGSTLYLQPFLPGAVLQYSSIDDIYVNDE